MEKEIKKEFIALQCIASINQKHLENLTKGLENIEKGINDNKRITEIFQLTLGLMSKKGIHDVKDAAAKIAATIAEIDALSKEAKK